ncbi:MAG: hypothetical protein V1781_01850 [Bacteroidota bacterium]
MFNFYQRTVPKIELVIATARHEAGSNLNLIEIASLICIFRTAPKIIYP